MRSVAELLEKLRQLGIYDRSLIVVASDHGMGIPPTGGEAASTSIAGLPELMGSSQALLLVKPVAHQGPVVTSTVPSAIGDIPATIAGALGIAHDFPGQSALELSEAPRGREFAHHPWADADWTRRYFSTLTIYSVDGPLRSAESWRLDRVITAPEDP
jgi:arylsulfatase A-like enzyme